ncbi:uncharacterized protein [Branchiostoma lanceolatum]|uniref:uncharacterized protein n=1 Tax=Branchiostoma lanceolatum TaxID=7740 RepID=UPI0034563DB9
MLQRDPSDLWVNNYNPHLLRAWNANMDIQYVVDPYSCAKYIVSYISKAEREMGKLLKEAQKEAREGNEDVVNEMRKVGSVYLTHREVSAQESVYRVGSLKLKECSRQVIFIPTDEKASRLSKPLATIQKLASAGNVDDGSIWMPNIVDRYRARPQQDPLGAMSLAEFVSEYRVVSSTTEGGDGSQSCGRAVKYLLRDNLGVVQKRTKSKPAVIRFAKFSKEKEPERYFANLLKLYLPHYSDRDLKPPPYGTYEDFYTCGTVSLLGGEDSVRVCDIVEKEKCKFEGHVDHVEQAREDLEKNVDVEDAWAQILPDVQEDMHAASKEQEVIGREESEDETEEDIPDLAQRPKSKDEHFTLQKCQVQMTRETAVRLMQSLNCKQKEVFYFVRDWCLKVVQGKRPDPFHVFVTGGGGTGKSHLIKCISYMASQLLQPTQENPDKVCVVLTAPTGTAAFNIGGSTVHHAFHVGRLQGMKYQPLSESTLNALRAEYESLKIVVIDEVSMVDKKLMSTVHGRLVQLCQGRPDARFGNVSILAVGDMFQIPPVKGQSLHKAGKGDIFPLWHGVFQVCELTEIMRQRDDVAFAQLLNRLRVKSKSQKLSEDDDRTLLSRVLSVDFSSDQYPKDVLHIFATNILVAQHNDKMLKIRCATVMTLEATDFQKNASTGALNKRKSIVKGGPDDLPNVFSVGVGARVMLSRNVDVEDGLVNGAFGTVTGVSIGEGNKPAVVFVTFDNSRVGVVARQKNVVREEQHVNSVAIHPMEDTLKSHSNVRRYQVPLKLAWACTVHKVQGLTVDAAVVCMRKMFLSGMSYVALSRVRSLGGLYLTEYNQEGIYCNEDVQEALEGMSQFEYCYNPFQEVSAHDGVKIVHHNTEGLANHLKSLKSSCLLEADVLCLTETWLFGDGHKHVQLEEYTMFHRNRLSDDTGDSVLGTVRSCHGGVAIYVRKTLKCQEVALPADTKLECVAVHVSLGWLETLILVMYRAPHEKKVNFISKVDKVLDYVCKVDRDTTIILGDFNENLLGSEDSQAMKSFLKTHGYVQVIEDPSTAKGTLLDHIYMSSVVPLVKSGVIQTFYSYHDAVYCMLSEGAVEGLEDGH